MKNILYSYIILPSFVFLAHLAAVFSTKIRKPLFKRYTILTELQKWHKENYNSSKKTIIIHSSSMGEFEHIKPLIKKLSENFQVQIIVTFFSPSGYEHIKSFPGVDIFLYLPFDFPGSWKKFYALARANLLIISKHDVWPNQIRIARKFNIKTILINASLNEKSSRNSFLARFILSSAYNTLDKIFVISHQDGLQFEKSFECKNIQISGDTKFDQVYNRKKESAEKEIIRKKWLSDNFIIVLGSLWPQDAEHILKEITKILDIFPDLKIIIVPHQPSEEHISLFSGYFKDYKYSLYSNNYENDSSRILIVDAVGVLADIYKHGHVAYIGGSFKQGIHNVMEPAVYGLPVIYGPVHGNSFEAKKLLAKGGSFSVNSSEEFLMEIQSLISDQNKHEVMGKNAFDYANQNSGATDKILKYVRDIIS